LGRAAGGARQGDSDAGNGRNIVSAVDHGAGDAAGRRRSATISIVMVVMMMVMVFMVFVVFVSGIERTKLTT
jgi:hypothetical protein